MIKSMVIGFGVMSFDLESISHRSEYKDLVKEICNKYPYELEVLDSNIRLYSSESGDYLIYNYIANCTENPKSADRSLSEFKKSVINLFDKFFKSLDILYIQL